jgi:methionine synthase I (cobalamin-dependent)
MAEYALKFAAEGVKIFGGCCGSTPDHIRAVVKALRQTTI